MCTPLLASSSSLGRPIGAPRVFYSKYLFTYLLRCVNAIAHVVTKNALEWNSEERLSSVDVLTFVLSVLAGCRPSHDMLQLELQG